MEEFYNVLVAMVVAFLLGLIVQYIWAQKGGKHIIIIGVPSFIIGMTIHSAIGHTLGEWLKKVFHFHENDDE